MPVTTTISGVQYSGIWSLAGQANAKALGTWPAQPPPPTFLYGWGRNNQGQLGLGNTTTYSSPKQVGSLNWLLVSATEFSTVAIKDNGTLWSWGANDRGQLGLGNITYYSSPKQVGALTSWSIAVCGGQNFTLAKKTDGTLWSWGRSYFGQLGLGNTTSYSSPKQVGALTNWLKVTAGYGHVLAIKTDGTLWGWGYNAFGQLGLNNTTYAFSSPNQVGALTTWANVTGGHNSTLAIKTDGTLWSWGTSNQGQLGLGNTTTYSSPKQVGALTAWASVYGGYFFSVAIKTDGTFWTWGQNNNGQLGLGNITYYSSPKQVGALTNWSSAATTGTGSNFGSIVAIKTDKTLWAWGNNQYGQLGLSNITNYSSPKQVGTSLWSQVANGTFQSFGITG